MNIIQWKKYIVRVGQDLAASLVLQKIEAQARVTLSRAIGRAPHLGYLISMGYESQLIMTLRRQCTKPRDENGISLKKILVMLKEEPQRRSLLRSTFIREAQKNAVAQTNLRERAFRSFGDPDLVFDEFAGAGNDVVDPGIIQRDLDVLDAAYTERLESFADKMKAHLEKRDVELPYLVEAHACLQVCWNLCERYHRLMFAKPHMDEVGVGPEMGWQRGFESIRVEIAT